MAGGAKAVKPLFSHIEDHEIIDAQKIVDQEFIRLTGKPFEMKVGGYFIACKIYIRPEEMKIIKRDDGSEVTLWHPPKALENDKYHSCAALVCGIGPQAFTGHDAQGHTRFPAGASCNVGDFIALPRQHSYLLSYRGVAMALVPDDVILGVISDPKDVTPINQASLI